MPDKIYYWRGVIGPISSLQPHQKTINKLMDGSYNPNDLEKLKGHDVYSYRINHSDRLLFSFMKIDGQSYLLLLDVVLNHDYHKSRFLRPGVLTRYIAQNESVIVGAITADDFVQTDLKIPRLQHEESADYEAVPVEYYKRQFIQLSSSQNEAVDLSLPAVIGGTAGSGKSCVAFSLLSNYVNANRFEVENKCSLLYVTESQPLVNEMKAIWQELPFANDAPHIKVQFSTYNELLQQLSDIGDKKIVGRNDFNDWYETYVSRYRKREKVQSKNESSLIVDPETTYQEFRICSAYTADQYHALGKRQSSLPIEQRKWLYTAYQAYRSDLGSRSCVHPAFQEIEQRDCFDLIIGDESQDFSCLQLKILYDMAKANAVAFCLDSHQSLSDAFSKRPFLLDLLHGKKSLSHVELKKTYRCPLNIVHAANKVIELKHRLIGGIADKDEATEVTTAINPDKMAGQVVVLSKDALDEASWLKEEAKGTHFAVITLPCFKEEAKKIFNTPLVFTPAEIKGLEYKTVVVYRLFPGPIFKEAYHRLQDKSWQKQPKHRTKDAFELDVFGPVCSQVFTAFTRAQSTLVICEESNRYTDILLDPLRQISTKEVTASIEETNDWEAEAEKQLQQGNTQQALDIRRLKLGKEEQTVQTPTQALNDSQQAVSPQTIVDLNRAMSPRPTQSKKLRRYVLDLYRQFDEGSLIKCLERSDFETLLFEIRIPGSDQSEHTLFEHLLKSETKIKIVMDCIASNHILGKQKAKFFLDALKQHEKEPGKITLMIKEKLMRVLFLCDTDLLDDPYIRDWIKTAFSKPLATMAKGNLFYWLTSLTRGIKILEAIFQKAPDLFDSIPPAHWGMLPPDSDNISALYWIVSTAEGRMFLQELMRKKPEILMAIPGQYWGTQITAYKYRNYSPLFFLVSPEGQVVLQQLINQNPEAIRAIPVDVWFSSVGNNERTNNSPFLWLTMSPLGLSILQQLFSEPFSLLQALPVETLSHYYRGPGESIITAFYSLTLMPEGIAILQMLFDQRPELFKALPIKDWYRACSIKMGVLAYTTALSYLATHPEGCQLLKDILDKQPDVLLNIPPAAWSLMQPACSGNGNVSPLYLLTAQGCGVEVLEKIMELNPGLLASISPVTWGLPVSHSDGSCLNQTPFYCLSAFQQNQVILKRLFETKPDLISAIPQSVWTQPLGGTNMMFENASALFWLLGSTIGLEILEKILAVNPDIIINFPLEAWCLPLTAKAGNRENISPLYLLCEKNQAFFLKLLNIMPEKFAAIPAQAWYLALTNQSRYSENCSPLYWLCNSDLGQEILDILLNINPDLITAIPTSAWCLPRVENGTAKGNTSPLFGLSSIESGQGILIKLAKENPEFIPNIPSSALTLAPRAGSDTNVSPLLFLTATEKGMEFLQMIVERVPQVITGVSSEAWNLSAPENNEYSFGNMFPLYCLASTPEGILLLRSMIATIPDTIRAIPFSAWTEERVIENGEKFSVLSCLNSTESGQSLLRDLRNLFSKNPEMTEDDLISKGLLAKHGLFNLNAAASKLDSHHEIAPNLK